MKLHPSVAKLFGFKSKGVYTDVIIFASKFIILSITIKSMAGCLKSESHKMEHECGKEIDPKNAENQSTLLHLTVVIDTVLLHFSSLTKKLTNVNPILTNV